MDEAIMGEWGSESKVVAEVTRIRCSAPLFTPGILAKVSPNIPSHRVRPPIPSAHSAAMRATDSQAVTQELT